MRDFKSKKTTDTIKYHQQCEYITINEQSLSFVVKKMKTEKMHILNTVSLWSRTKKSASLTPWN